MKKIYYLVFVVLILACNPSKEKKEFVFFYEFENEDSISSGEVSETIFVLNKRLNQFSNQHEITEYKRKKLKVKITDYGLDTLRLNKIILNKGKLEFWELYKVEEMFPEVLKMGSFYEDKAKDSLKNKPFLDMFTALGHQYGPIIAFCKAEDTVAINKMLNDKDTRFQMKPEYINTKFLWGIADENNNLPLYAAKSNRNNIPPLTGESILKAKQVVDVVDRPAVLIEMNKEGAITWERLTENAFKNASYIAVTLNDLVYSAPGVTVGPIQGGLTQIAGDFTLSQAQDLAIILSSQKSIPQLRPIQDVTQ